MNQTDQKQTFNPAQLIQQALGYAKHTRLMLVMLAFGVLLGIAFYVFARPIYQAKSLVFIQSFGAPVRDSELPGMSASKITRNTLFRLSSQELKIGAARRLGLLGETATFEDFQRHIPKVRFGLTDPFHIEVTVIAYSPEVTRNFSKALVDEFQSLQEEGWEQFRDEALDRYQKQLVELDEKISENIEELAELEREEKFTEAKFEQRSMLEIPRELVRTRELIKQMESIKGILDRYDGKDLASDDVLFILSLLSGFEKDSGLAVGQLINAPGVGSTAPIGQNGEASVVIPPQVEGLEEWRELEKKKRNLEFDIKESSEIYLPDHPKMRELIAELEKTERSLLTEMEVMRQKFDLEFIRLQEKVVQLEKRIPDFQEATDQFGRSQNTYTSVEMSKRMWAGARQRLSDKLSTLSFVDEFDWVELRFKGHTSLRDKIPVSPAKKKIALMGLLMGLAGAIGLPTLLNLIDTTVKNLPQLEDLTGLRGIGIVPLSDPEELESVHRSPAQGAHLPNFLLECFRIIRSNIGLDAAISNGHPSQVILVTSARPQEGKTTQAANLAWAFNSIGEKVLLVDCDLRRGRVHSLLKIENENGVSRLLTGEVSAQEAIQSTELNSFDTIPRGPIIPGASELLCQNGFEELLETWRTQYDRIILDCPPILGLSESNSLQRVCDGVVLVVRSEQTSTKDVRDGIQILNKVGAHFFGFVLNGVDLSKVGNYYQYYYYSAPYYNHFDESTLDEGEPFDNSSERSSPEVDESHSGVPAAISFSEKPTKTPTSGLINERSANLSGTLSGDLLDEEDDTLPLDSVVMTDAVMPDEGEVAWEEDEDLDWLRKFEKKS